MMAIIELTKVLQSVKCQSWMPLLQFVSAQMCQSLDLSSCPVSKSGDRANCHSLNYSRCHQTMSHWPRKKCLVGSICCIPPEMRAKALNDGELLRTYLLPATFRT
jgi:hypothetical protein